MRRSVWLFWHLCWLASRQGVSPLRFTATGGGGSHAPYDEFLHSAILSRHLGHQDVLLNTTKLNAPLVYLPLTKYSEQPVCKLWPLLSGSVVLVDPAYLCASNEDTHRLFTRSGAVAIIKGTFVKEPGNEFFRQYSSRPYDAQRVPFLSVSIHTPGWKRVVRWIKQSCVKHSDARGLQAYFVCPSESYSMIIEDDANRWAPIFRHPAYIAIRGLLLPLFTVAVCYLLLSQGLNSGDIRRFDWLLLKFAKLVDGGSLLILFIAMATGVFGPGGTLDWAYCRLLVVGLPWMFLVSQSFYMACESVVASSNVHVLTNSQSKYTLPWWLFAMLLFPCSLDFTILRFVTPRPLLADLVLKVARIICCVLLWCCCAKNLQLVASARRRPAFPNSLARRIVRSFSTGGFAVCLAMIDEQAAWTPQSQVAVVTLALVFRIVASFMGLYVRPKSAQLLYEAFRHEEEAKQEFEHRPDVNPSASSMDSERLSSRSMSGVSRLTPQTSRSMSTWHDEHEEYYSASTVRGEHPRQLLVRPYSATEYASRFGRLYQRVNMDDHMQLICFTNPSTIFHLFGIRSNHRLVSFVVFFDDSCAIVPEAFSNPSVIGRFQLAHHSDFVTCFMGDDGNSDDPNGPADAKWHGVVLVDSSTAHPDELAGYTICDALRAHGWIGQFRQRHTIGMELGAVSSDISFVLNLARAFKESDFEVEDVAEGVSLSRLEMSRYEQAYIFEARDVLAQGVRDVQQFTKIGASTMEIHTHHSISLAQQGADVRGAPPTSVSINSGGLGEMVSREIVKGGDVVHLDLTISYKGCLVGCTRSFYLKPYPSPFPLAPRELLYGFYVAGGLFGYIENVVFPGDPVTMLYQEVQDFFQSQSVDGAAYPVPLDDDAASASCSRIFQKTFGDWRCPVSLSVLH